MIAQRGHAPFRNDIGEEPLQDMGAAFFPFVALGIVVATPAVAQETQPEQPDVAQLDVRLVCNGIGSRPDSTTSNVTVYGSGRSASGIATTNGTEEVPERVEIEIIGNTGRIHFPRALVPPINSGGSDGWWPLRNVQTTETEINARFSLNFLNKPNMRIDRMSGDIEISGWGRTGFRGDCAPEIAAPRKF